MPSSRTSRPFTAPILTNSQKVLIRKACVHGDIEAIREARSRALSTRSDADAALVAHIFATHISHIQGIHTFKATQMPRKPLSSIIRSALAAMADVYITRLPILVSRRNAIFASVNAVSEFWPSLRSWSVLAIDQCLDLAVPDYETAYRLDFIFHLLFEGYVKINPGLMLDSEELRVFTRLWIQDLDAKQFTQTLPTLAFRCYFPANQFVVATGLSLRDIVSICNAHLEMLLDQLSDPSKGERVTSLVATAGLIGTLMGKLDSMMSIAALTGMVPPLVRLFCAVASYRQWLSSDPRLYTRSLQSMMLILSMLLQSGSSYVSQAVDAGIIDGLLEISFLCSRTDDYEYSADLAPLIPEVTKCLAVIQLCLHHRRILPHIRRGVAKIQLDRVNMVSPTQLDKEWIGLFRQTAYITALEKEWKGLWFVEWQPCDNLECPRRYQKSIQLKECMKCHSQLVCSKECQRAAWSRHKEMCDSITERQKDAPETLLVVPVPPDVVKFYKYVICHFVTSHPRSSQVHRDHYVQLHGPSASRRPSHILKIDHQVDMSLSELAVEPVTNYAGIECGLDGCLNSLAALDPDDDYFICCADVSFGIDASVPFFAFCRLDD